MSQRAWQLLLGVVAMMAISSPQYVWALMVHPAMASLKTTLPTIQVTIAIFSVCMAGLGPVHGFLAAKAPPKLFVATGGMLIGLSWILSSFATSVGVFYFTYGVLSGLGAGIVYVGVTQLMLQWFPDRRGLAVGLVAGSYGMGAVVTTFPISQIIQAYDYRVALLCVGGVLGLVGMAAGAAMRAPTADEQQAARVSAAPLREGDATPVEMLKAPAFWLLFLMMTMVGTGGLMAISQIAVFAKAFGITETTTVLGLAALPFALTVDRICNGASRPIFGWISDHLGREKTMALAFTLEAVGILALLRFGHDPVMFVILTGVVFLGWGEIFSLFPAAQADLFGTTHAARNFGFLFISIAVASIFGGPLAAYVFHSTGSWAPVFYLVSGLDLAAAILAIGVLKPLRERHLKVSGNVAAAAG